MPTVHLTIKGKVQGVFYRATAKEVAEEIGVTGWVRNTEEGYVEIEATGTVGQLRKLIEWCRIGPKRAVVKDIIIDNKSEEPFNAFEIRR